MGWFNHQPVQGFNIVSHFSLVLACWASRTKVLVETFCVIFSDPKPGESPCIYLKIHLLFDMFFLENHSPVFFGFPCIFFSQCYLCSESFWSKRRFNSTSCGLKSWRSRQKASEDFPPNRLNLGSHWGCFTSMAMPSTIWRIHGWRVWFKHCRRNWLPTLWVPWWWRGGWKVKAAGLLGKKFQVFWSPFFRGRKRDGCWKYWRLLCWKLFFGQCYAMGCWGFPPKKLQQNVSEDKPFILLKVLFRTDANLSTPPLS